MARACPHCGERITYLKYTAATRGWETGTYSESGDHERDDSGTDGTEDYVFYCPECDTRIRERAEWIEGEDEDEDEQAAPAQSGWSNLI